MKKKSDMEKANGTLWSIKVLLLRNFQKSWSPDLLMVQRQKEELDFDVAVS
jgi:hypothetical protein